jgi:hypothetical protein
MRLGRMITDEIEWCGLDNETERCWVARLGRC